MTATVRPQTPRPQPTGTDKRCKVCRNITRAALPGDTCVWGQQPAQRTAAGHERPVRRGTGGLMNRRRTDAPAPTVQELLGHLYAEHLDLRNRHADFLGTPDEPMRDFLLRQLRIQNEYRHNLLVSLSECAQ